MPTDRANFSDHAGLAVAGDVSDFGHWHCQWTVRKYDPKYDLWVVKAGLVEPYETIEREGNLLVDKGVLNIWTALTGGAITTYAAANAHIGVGDSNTAASNAQVNLQAATNKFRQPMDSPWPKVGAAGGAANDRTVEFKATFATADANFAWAEWGIFNHVSAATTAMLQRKVESLGTKVSGAWSLTVALSL